MSCSKPGKASGRSPASRLEHGLGSVLFPVAGVLVEKDAAERRVGGDEGAPVGERFRVDDGVADADEFVDDRLKRAVVRSFRSRSAISRTGNSCRSSITRC